MDTGNDLNVRIRVAAAVDSSDAASQCEAIRAVAGLVMRREYVDVSVGAVVGERDIRELRDISAVDREVQQRRSEGHGGGNSVRDCDDISHQNKVSARVFGSPDDIQSVARSGFWYTVAGRGDVGLGVAVIRSSRNCQGRRNARHRDVERAAVEVGRSVVDDLDDLSEELDIVTGVIQSPSAVENVRIGTSLVSLCLFILNHEAWAVVFTADWRRRESGAIVNHNLVNVREGREDFVIDNDIVCVGSAVAADVSGDVSTLDDERTGAVVVGFDQGDIGGKAAVVDGLEGGRVTG